MLPLECWTEILQWLEKPEEIDRISLVKPGFYSIFERKLHRKYGEEKKMVPDLEFCREIGTGTAMLCKTVERASNCLESVKIPIAVVPPPDYLMPPKNISVHHLDDKVLSFFIAISESWFNQDLVLKLPNPDLYPHRRLIHTANNVQLKALMQLLSKRVSGRDKIYNDTDKPLHLLNDWLCDEFVLGIPLIRYFKFESVYMGHWLSPYESLSTHESVYMSRWLSTPTSGGKERVFIVWTISSELIRLITQDFSSATVSCKFLIICRERQFLIDDCWATFFRWNEDKDAELDFRELDKMHRDELRNEGTRERLCFRPSSLIDGCWSTVFRCPWNEEPDFCELDRKYRSQVLNGLSSVGPCIYVFAKSHSLHRLE